MQGQIHTNEAGEEIITLNLENDVIQPTQGATPAVSTRKTQAGRGVKRSLEPSTSTNTAAQYADQKEDSVSGIHYPAYLF